MALKLFLSLQAELHSPKVARLGGSESNRLLSSLPRWTLARDEKNLRVSFMPDHVFLLNERSGAPPALSLLVGSKGHPGVRRVCVPFGFVHRHKSSLDVPFKILYEKTWQVMHDRVDKITGTPSDKMQFNTAAL